MKNKSKVDPHDLCVTRVDIENVAYYACGYKSTHKVLALTGLVGAGDDEQSMTSARRIVACIRACAGIDTEALEFFIDRLHGAPEKPSFKDDVADTEISVKSEANKAIAITTAMDVIEKARHSARYS